MKKTTHPKLADLKKVEKWYLVDAENKVLGQVASQVADLLRGKGKPIFHPSVICGDNVIIINAEKVVLTGKKLTDKTYTHFTGYPGGLREVSAEKMLEKHPERVLEKAIQGMIPRNRLRKLMLARLYVYAGPNHEHTAQNPQPITLK